MRFDAAAPSCLRPSTNQRRTIGEPPQRYVITRKDGQPMSIAGLWESYVWPDKRIERTYCYGSLPDWALELVPSPKAAGIKQQDRPS